MPIMMTISIVASSFPDARLINSTVSRIKAIPVKAKKTLTNQNKKWRDRYLDNVSDKRTLTAPSLSLPLLQGYGVNGSPYGAELQPTASMLQQSVGQRMKRDGTHHGSSPAL